MKPDKIYNELIELAEKFDISVSEENLRKTMVKAKSGFCIVNNHKRFIIDKHLTVHKKIEALASYLSALPHEDLYIIPALRDVLYRYEDRE